MKNCIDAHSYCRLSRRAARLLIPVKENEKLVITSAARMDNKDAPRTRMDDKDTTILLNTKYSSFIFSSFLFLFFFLFWPATSGRYLPNQGVFIERSRLPDFLVCDGDDALSSLAQN
jgi:hypothetical protein